MYISHWLSTKLFKLYHQSFSYRKNNKFKVCMDYRYIVIINIISKYSVNFYPERNMWFSCIVFCEENFDGMKFISQFKCFIV